MVNAADTFGIDPAMGHPERALALSYAPRAGRAGLIALFALDAMLAQLARHTRDAMVAQMRLTWWSEALERLDTAPPPGQPILAALAASVLPRNVSGAALVPIVDGWLAWLAGDADAHAEARGVGLFAAAGALCGSTADPLTAAGRGWALADLARGAAEPATSARLAALAAAPLAAADRRWSRAGRALGAMALSARMDLAGSPPGAPRRVARLLRLRLTGR